MYSKVLTKMIDIFYYSWTTGNTKAFVDKLPFECMNIEDNPTALNPFVLLTPTYYAGQIPDFVDEWLAENYLNLQGVVGFGNRNWGLLFAAAADKISDKYNVPVLDKVEIRGTNEDVLRVGNRLSNYEMKVR